MKTPNLDRFHHMTNQDKEFRSWSLLVLVMLGFVLRMYHITAPPDDFLSWRDTQTLMSARNFFEGGMNLFFPEVDWRNSSDVSRGGVVGMTELMVTPWLTAFLYQFFGMAYWVGRVVPICFSLLGIVFFHRLAARFQGEVQATVAATLLTFLPYFYYCGRTQMPEAFAFCMVFATLYTYDIWLKEGGVWRFFLAVLFAVLMLLGKPQMGVHVVAMAYLTFARFGARTPITGSLYAFGIWVTVPFAAYWWWSNVILLEEARLSFGGPVFYQFQRILGDPEYYVRMGRAIFFESVTPAVCVLAALGLFFGPYGKRGFFAHAWLLSALLLFIVFPGGTKDNGYYQLILEPPCALLAARVLGPCFTRRRLRPVAGLVVVGASAYALSIGVLMFQPKHTAERLAGEWIRENLPEDALIITETGNPALLYFADRKGWTSWQEEHGIRADFTMEWIERLREQGADAIAITNPYFDSFQFTDNALKDELYNSYASHEGAGFTVFLLDTPADLSLAGGADFTTRAARKYLRGLWSAPQSLADGNAGIALAHAPNGGIRFTSTRPPAVVLLDVAAPLAGQTLTVHVNNRLMSTVSFPRANAWGQLELRDLPPRDAQGGYMIFLEVDLLDEETRTGLYLRSIEVLDEDPGLAAPQALLN